LSDDFNLNENIITFKSYRPWINEKDLSAPSTTQSVMPLWYKEADRFAKNQFNGEYYKATKDICPVAKDGTVDDYGKIPTWKACPAIMDAFATGYVLKTPCDIKFFKNSNGIIDVEVLDTKNKDFCLKRNPMPQFEHPKGFYADHFAWYSQWGLELPEGYSALFMTPLNRFDLPFLNTTGIVDCDKVHILGTFPFFIVEGWEGILPAGTPYLQIIPFKREDWKQKIEILDSTQIVNSLVDNANFYRKPDGGVYKNKIWSRRKYI
jgi:hypothetical protein